MNPERERGPLDEALETADELSSEAVDRLREELEAASEALSEAGDTLASVAEPPRARARPEPSRAVGMLEEARDWAEAVALGVGDTLRDMLRAGRRGAREAQADHWARFDAKTRYRRKRREGEES